MVSALPLLRLTFASSPILSTPNSASKRDWRRTASVSTSVGSRRAVAEIAHQEIITIRDDVAAWVVDCRGSVDKLPRVYPPSVAKSLNVARDGVAEELANPGREKTVRDVIRGRRPGHSLSNGEVDPLAVSAVIVQSDEAPQAAERADGDAHGRTNAHVGEVLEVDG